MSFKRETTIAQVYMDSVCCKVLVSVRLEKYDCGNIFTDWALTALDLHFRMLKFCLRT